MNFKHILGRLLVYLFASLVAVLLAVFAYSTWFEKPYLSYTDLPFPTPNQVEQGQVLVAQVSRCSTSKKVETYRTTIGIRNEVTSAAPVVLPSVTVTVDPGCNTVTSKLYVVPEEVFPGFWRFKGEALVGGLLKIHKVEWYTDVFEVVPRGQLTKPQGSKK